MLSSSLGRLSSHVLVLAAVAGTVHSEEQADAPLPADEAARSMILPDGFQATLFAGEPDVRQPIAFCIDDRGRLWVAENYNYPNHGTKAGDRILIFEDSDGDGRFDERTVFYDRLNYVSGIEVGFGGAWVMSPPYFYFIPDKDGDDKPDSEPTVLLDGFGNHANAHNMANGFAWGPDGWLYGTHGRTNWSMVGKPGTPKEKRVRFDGGVYRYHPTRHVWEPYADGTTNPWGIDWDDYGQAFICNCVNPHLFHVIPGAHYEPWRNRKSSEYAYERIPTIADHLHFTGTGNVRDGIGSDHEDAAGGGHAHCGTMVYLGDNWPDRYRNSLFTNNIHGRRINNDILKRKGSSYVASHGPDLMKSRDPWFMGVTLAYGPDGSVFVSDWSDTGECHSTRNTRRETGRIFKISYGTPKHVTKNPARLSNEELVQFQLHKNDWWVRHARRVLQERAATGADMTSVHESLREIFDTHPEVPRKLRALWALHVTDGLPLSRLRKQLHHESRDVRAWAVQLLCEGRQPAGTVVRDLAVEPPRFEETIRQLTLRAQAVDELPSVRLALASALQRLPARQRWPIAVELARHGEDAEDPSLPLMLWYGIEPLVEDDLPRFVQLAESTEMPLVRRHIARRVTSLPPERRGLDLLVASLNRNLSPAHWESLLEGILTGLEGRRRVAMPPGWRSAFSRIQAGQSPAAREMAIRLALIFDDPEALALLRSLSAETGAEPARRNQAIRALVARRIDGLETLLLGLLSDEAVQTTAIQGLAEYDDPDTPAALLSQYKSFSATVRESAIQTLSARKQWAAQLLGAIESGSIPRDDLSAFAARQIHSLGDKELTTRLTKVWGAVRSTPSSRAREIASYRKRLTAKELAKADLSAGRVVFNKVCSSCHRLFDSGGKIGPDLSGAQRTNLDYVLENLIDPSALLSKDFQMEIVETESGRVITGLVVSDTDAAVTIQTATERIIVPAAEIEFRRKSDVSMMPEGQLKKLPFTQVRDLVAYLASPKQVPLPDDAGDAATDQAEWQSLFNGKDLTGWKANSRPESYSVQDGILKVHGKNGMSHLFFVGADDKDDIFVNFEFEAEARAEPNSNSGIFFHTSRELRNRKYLNKGYEVQLNSTKKEKRKTGSLYAVVDLDESPVDETKWFTIRFRVEGRRIQVWVNDSQVVDYTEPKNPRRDPSRAGRLIDPEGGAIAIQAHDPGSVFYFRTIRIRRLP